MVTGRLHFRDLIPTVCPWLSLANLNDAVFGIERIPKGLGVHRGVLPAWESFLSTPSIQRPCCNQEGLDPGEAERVTGQ